MNEKSPLALTSEPMLVALLATAMPLQSRDLLNTHLRRGSEGKLSSREPSGHTRNLRLLRLGPIHEEPEGAVTIAMELVTHSERHSCPRLSLREWAGRGEPEL